MLSVFAAGVNLLDSKRAETAVQAGQDATCIPWRCHRATPELLWDQVRRAAHHPAQCWAVAIPLVSERLDLPIKHKPGEAFLRALSGPLTLLRSICH